jgi:hypothetical protein
MHLVNGRSCACDNNPTDTNAYVSATGLCKNAVALTTGDCGAGCVNDCGIGWVKTSATECTKTSDHCQSSLTTDPAKCLTCWPHMNRIFIIDSKAVSNEGSCPCKLGYSSYKASLTPTSTTGTGDTSCY